MQPLRRSAPGRFHFWSRRGTRDQPSGTIQEIHQIDANKQWNSSLVLLLAPVHSRLVPKLPAGLAASIEEEEMDSARRSNVAVIASGIAVIPSSPPSAKRTRHRKPWFIRFMLALKESRRRAAQREMAAYSHLRRYAEAMDRDAAASMEDWPFRWF
jgi:hypothetical protein